MTFEGTCRTILDVVEQHDAGLIVLGTRGLSTFKSVMLGSASRSVAQNADRPVLIVPLARPAEKVIEPVEQAATE